MWVKLGEEYEACLRKRIKSGWEKAVIGRVIRKRATKARGWKARAHRVIFFPNWCKKKKKKKEYDLSDTGSDKDRY